MAVHIDVKRRLINPRTAQRKRAGTRLTGRKRNPAPLVTVGAINPRSKRTMTKAKKRRPTSQRRRRNPIVNRRPRPRARTRTTYRRRRRNPITRPVGALQLGLTALVGLVVTRQLPQLILGARNKGIVGYASNFVTALLAGFGAGKLAKKHYGEAVMIGGMLYVVNRILQEQFSPVGKVLSLAGVGDAGASGHLGAIEKSYFPLPVIVGRDGAPVIPEAIIEATRREIAAAQAAQAAQPAPGPAPATVRGLSRGIR